MATESPLPFEQNLTDQAEQRKQNITQLDTLPAIPLILSNIIECANDEKSSITQLRNLILQDQSVTAKILQMANTKYISQKKRVSTVTDAVVTIGFQAVVDVTVGFTLSQTFRHLPPSGEMDLREFWLHTLAAAEAGRVIAKRIHYPQNELAYLLGLLHDLGKLVQLEACRKDFENALFDARAEELPLHEIEKRSYDCHHGDIGAWLGEAWQLPVKLLFGMAYHHNPSAAPKEHGLEAALAHCADYFVHAAEIGQSGNPVKPPPPEDSLNTLGISRSAMQKITADLVRLRGRLGTIMHVIDL